MFDCVVIGLGGVGSFALRAVARDLTKAVGSTTSTSSTTAIRGGNNKQPYKILGLERYELNHAKGSSHGKSRVYRKAYFEHPSYVPWCTYSENEFKLLEQSSNVNLLEECGVLVVAPSQQRSWLDACLAAARQHNIPVEELNTKQLQDKFPQYRYAGGKDMVGVYESGGGMVRPERAVSAALDEARSMDCVDVWEHCQVLSMTEKPLTKDTTVDSQYQDDDDNGRNVKDQTYVELVVTKQNSASSSDADEGSKDPVPVTIAARKVLIAAGAWTSTILPTWSPHLKPIRILQSWVDISNARSDVDTEDRNPLSLYSVSNMPCTVMVNPDELPIPVYVLPADPDADDGKDDHPDRFKTCVKLGIHGDVCGHGQIQDPDTNHRLEVTSEEQSYVDDAIRSALNSDVSAQLPCVETIPCMYTMTNDENFMIGVPEGYTNVCAVAGLSGHGFKMAPALGQMLADFASGKGLDHWDAEFCSPKRFGV